MSISSIVLAIAAAAPEFGPRCQLSIAIEGAASDQLSELRDQLQSNDVDERVAAATGLGELGQPAVDLLIGALGDKRSDVRRAAALSLGRIGSEAEAATPDLIEACSDKRPTVREAAVIGLGGMGASAIPPLLELLEEWPEPESCLPSMSIARIVMAHPDSVSIVGDAIDDTNFGLNLKNELFWLVPLAEKPVMPTLIEWARDADVELARLMALGALARCEATEEVIESELVNAAASPDDVVRWSAAEGLGWRAVQSDEAVEALSRLTTENAEFVQDSAAWALARCGPQGVWYLLTHDGDSQEADWFNNLIDVSDPHLVAGLVGIVRVEGADARIRHEALGLLKVVGNGHRMVEAAIIELLEQSPDELKAASFDTGESQSFEDDELRSRFRQLCIEHSGSTEAAIRSAASRALFTVSASGEAPEAFEVAAATRIVGALGEPGDAELETVRCIGGLGSAALEAGPWLAEVVDESEGELALTAALALERIGDSRAPAALARFVAGNDVEAMLHATDAIMRTEPDVAISAIDDELHSSLDPGLKSRFLPILETFGAERAGPVLRACVGEFDAATICFVFDTADELAVDVDGSAYRGDLKRMLSKDDDPQRRAVAARGLGGLRDRSVLSSLSKAVNDTDSGVAMAAVEAIGKLVEEDPRAIKTLTRVLGQSNGEYLQGAAAIALAKNRAAAEPAIDDLLEMAEDESHPGRFMAIWALGEMGVKDARVVRKLRSLLEDDNQSASAIESAVALGKLGAREAIPELGARVWDGTNDMRQAAALALASLGDESSSELVRLIYRLNWSKALRVRVACARALGAMGSDALAAVPALARGAIEIKPEKRAFEPARKSEAGMASEVMAILAGTSTEVSQFDQTSWKDVRLACIQALGQVGEGAVVATSVLNRVRQDPDADIRSAAELALDLIQP